MNSNGKAGLPELQEMINDNDSFIHEVNQELRSERIRNAWRRFGPAIISLAVLIVLGTSAWRGYQYWNERRSSAAGDRFTAALVLARQGEMDEALKELAALEREGYGFYDVLARMRAAAIEAGRGEIEKAAEAFRSIANDGALPEVLRDIAKLRAAWILIDSGNYDDVSSLAEPLATQAGPFRHSAREALGLAAYGAGDLVKAREWFEQIAEDPMTPANVASRARMILGNITASGNGASEAE